MRTTSGIVHKNRRKRVLKATKGFRGARHRLYRIAKQALLHAGQHGFESRRQKKREMRSLWILRINAAVRPHGVSYSRFVHMLAQQGIQLNRKMMADLAYSEPASFEALVKEVLAKVPAQA